jgi:multiple sugar transport system substrate-binding protein
MGKMVKTRLETHTRITRRVFLGSLPLSVIGGLAACRPHAQGGPPREEPAAPVLPVPRTIEYWSAAATGAALQAQTAMIERYQALNPGVTVTTAVAPYVQNVPEKTITAIAAGAPPTFDRFMIASFAIKDTFTPLSRLARRDGITEREYYPFAWAEAGYNGELYALPYQTGIRALYYNRAHLRDAGLDPEQPPRTLTELDQQALRLTRQEGDRYTRVGFIPWIGNSHFYTWGWLFGGEFYDEKTRRCTANHPRNIEALEWLASYARRYGDERLRAFEATFSTVQGGAFIGELVSFFHTTQTLIQDLARLAPQIDYAVMPLPPAPGRSTTSTWSGGFGYIIPRGAKQVEAAWHFIKFMGSDEGELLWTQTTFNLPVRVNVAGSDFWRQQAQDPRVKVFLDLLPISRHRPIMPAAQRLWDELIAAVDLVRKGQLSAKDALDAVTQRVNLELAQLGL